VVGCPNGCIGDASYVGSGGNNIPMDKKAWSPRVGFAYALDSKTVIRSGYGIFFIPNYVSFGLNPDNDVVNLATTPFVATKDSFQTPFSTLDGFNCTLSGGPNPPTCAEPGPFGAGGIVLPPGRNAQPTLSAFVVANGSPTLAPHADPKYGYVEQYNFDIQRQLPAGFFVDVAYAGSHGVHLEQYSTHINQIPDSFLSQGAALTTQVPNPLTCPSLPGGICPNANLTGATIAAGQLDRPYPQYNNLQLGGYGCCSSTYNSLQATLSRRFAGGGTLLVAYTNAKLLSNTDTLTSWLEGSTGGVGQVQDWNNLKGEKSLSSQDVSQRLVITYVLDLPFGHGKMFASGYTGAMNKVVSGWGIDGETAFQRGFPLKITYAASTPLEQANLGVSNVRPNVVSGCNKKSGGGNIGQWFNTSCFAAPPDWGFGSESRVDSVLRGPGINNWDFALFKRTTITERVGLEFRTEFFNLFNHPYFAMPATGFGAPGFGEITGTVQSGAASPERLIQFALKLVF
jgi:hypothetical protein